MTKNKDAALMPVEQIAQSILILRGQRVLLDSELAALYGVSTKRFNQQVRRNLARFPEDFMFQLSTDEASALRLQFATLKTGRGQHRKYLPYAFTEHGAIMAATILDSSPAVEMSVYVVRAFVHMRDLLASNRPRREVRGARAQGFLARPSHRRHPQGHPRTHARAGAEEAADRIYSESR